MKNKIKMELSPVGGFISNEQHDVLLEEVYDMMQMQHLYESAIKEISTKLEILDSEFQTKFDYNPIHHMESRLKSPQSIADKLSRKNLTFSTETAMKTLMDIAGIRVVCHYIEDIYNVAELLTSQDDITLVKRKDYIKNPKPNGYRSLHIVINVPVFLAEKKEIVPVEVQIRTIAMDFWASLEHQLKYKSDDGEYDSLYDELKSIADTIADTDIKMQNISKRLKNL